MRPTEAPVSDTGCAWPLCREDRGLVPFVRVADGRVFTHCPPHDFAVKVAFRQQGANA